MKSKKNILGKREIHAFDSCLSAVVFIFNRVICELETCDYTLITPLPKIASFSLPPIRDFDCLVERMEDKDRSSMKAFRVLISPVNWRNKITIIKSFSIGLRYECSFCDIFSISINNILIDLEISVSDLFLVEEDLSKKIKEIFKNILES